MSAPAGSPTVSAIVVRLTADDTVTDSVRALLFGALADLAVPLVTAYRSDLYHDAHWIATHVTGAITFFFAVRPHGTHIGWNDPRQLLRGTGAMAYRVEVTRDRVFWTATLTQLTI